MQQLLRSVPVLDRMRKIIIVSWLVVIFSGVIAIFWYNEWLYNLPTPIPAGYTAPAMGSKIHLAGITIPGDNKPVFLHFFNPDCPCSRFNIEHVRSLVKHYGRAVSFKLVLITNKKYTEEQIQREFDLDIPVLTDTGMAKICGVYSTPQAVIIDQEQELYYRGNYNRSRYCIDKKSNYAALALNSLLQHHLPAGFDRFALQAYGCQLPGCSKQ